MNYLEAIISLIIEQCEDNFSKLNYQNCLLFSHPFIPSKGQVFDDDCQQMPSSGNVCLGFLSADCFTYLSGNFLHWHYPKQSLTFCHCSVNKPGSDIGNNDMSAILESSFAQSLHIINLISFGCAVCGALGSPRNPPAEEMATRWPLPCFSNLW